METITNDSTLTAIRNRINSLDIPEKDSILELVTLAEQNNKRRQKILALVQEALGQLRMDIKYLMFDLEATRRERDSFKGK